MTPPVSGGVPEQGLREELRKQLERALDGNLDALTTLNRFAHLVCPAALERPRPAPSEKCESCGHPRERCSSIWCQRKRDELNGAALPAEPPHHREISLSVEAFIEKREENGAEIPEKVAALLFDLGTHLCGAAEHAPPDLTRLREQYANYKNRPRDNAMRDAVDYMFLCDKLMAFIDDHWGSRPALAGSPDESAEEYERRTGRSLD